MPTGTLPAETAAEELESESEASDSLEGLLREVARLPDATPPASGRDRSGDRIAHFRIRSRVGQGGMGIVYRADDLTLRREVALKVLPDTLVADRDRRRRFLREARSASAVLHANLATVFEVGESEGTVFIAMEFVEGETLRKRLRAGRVAPSEAVRVAREIARGVGKAHARGVVHRDLKPENVMIADDGAVKVLDFGLAKLVDAPEIASDVESDSVEADDIASHVGKVLGTPGYMSPEQARGSSVDARSDVFSLGVMLYEMLAGDRPFRANTTRELLRAIEHASPPPVRDAAPSVNAPLARIVDRCLAKRPEDRLPDCGALYAELERVHLAMNEVRAPRLLTWLVGAGLAAVLGGGAFWAWRSREAARDVDLSAPALQTVSTAARASPSSPEPSNAVTESPAPGSAERSRSPEPVAAPERTSSADRMRPERANPVRSVPPSAAAPARESATAASPAPRTQEVRRVDLGF